jgi:aspartyl-tRNA(Asn)/glutamyl-tRNA(Gln) amidotransferase subunit B
VALRRGPEEILTEVLATDASPDAIVMARGLIQISDASELSGIVAEVLREHPGPVTNYRAGKTEALTFLVGQVMKKTRGRANPELVNRLLKEKLEGGK